MPDERTEVYESLSESLRVFVDLFSIEEIRNMINVPSFRVQDPEAIVKLQEWLNTMEPEPKPKEPVNDLLNGKTCRDCGSKSLKVDKIESIAFRFYCENCGLVNTGIRETCFPNSDEGRFLDPF